MVEHALQVVPSVIVHQIREDIAVWASHPVLQTRVTMVETVRTITVFAQTTYLLESCATGSRWGEKIFYYLQDGSCWVELRANFNQKS